MHNPLFRHLFQHESSQTPERASSSRQSKTVTATFISASSAQEGGKVIARALMAKLSRVLGMPCESSEPSELDRSLVSFGVDSLVGLELKNWLSKEAGADLAVFEILSGATFEEIGELVAVRSALRPVDWSAK
ncbi:unnamed protein product [Periconia digitata]|uniref:Carrier domain-containing protein n=1 Tax=Periconia digitata TaxID=1303443 RepID=A0A9W4UT83_9PLEO|nr:unnamed protein product [Periconia digitata]